MIAKFHVEGTIEIDLSDYQIKKLNTNKSITMKKAFLEDVLRNALNGCAQAGDIELGYKVDFDNLYVKTNKELAEKEIETENIALTNKEEEWQTMIEIGRRKKRNSIKWKSL